VEVGHKVNGPDLVRPGLFIFATHATVWSLGVVISDEFSSHKLNDCSLTKKQGPGLKPLVFAGFFAGLKPCAPSRKTKHHKNPDELGFLRLASPRCAQNDRGFVMGLIENKQRQVQKQRQRQGQKQRQQQVQRQMRGFLAALRMTEIF
jgi:hypothetical protein